MAKHRFSVKRITVLGIFTALLIAQEELLTVVPNFQFTSCLLTIYFFSFGFKDSIIIAIIHSLVDSFIWGFSLIYTPTMVIAWSLLIIILQVFKKVLNNHKFIVALVVAFHGIIYSLCFSFTTVVLDLNNVGVTFIARLISDLPFVILLIVSNFLTTYLLFEPLTKALSKLVKDSNL